MYEENASVVRCDIREGLSFGWFPGQKNAIAIPADPGNNTYYLHSTRHEKTAVLQLIKPTLTVKAIVTREYLPAATSPLSWKLLLPGRYAANSHQSPFELSELME